MKLNKNKVILFYIEPHLENNCTRALIHRTNKND